jgi:DNA-binding NtrC family response regulator
MPNSPIKILIAEDAELLPELMEKRIRPLLDRFPGSEVVFARSLEAVLRIIACEPPPTVTALDLTLDDAGFEKTLSYVEEIDRRSPVVVVTGANLDGWAEKLKALNIEVISKVYDDWLGNNFLVNAIIRAWRRRQDREEARLRAQRERMEEIHQELSNAAP